MRKARANFTFPLTYFRSGTYVPYLLPVKFRRPKSKVLFSAIPINHEIHKKKAGGIFNHERSPVVKIPFSIFLFFHFSRFSIACLRGDGALCRLHAAFPSHHRFSSAQFGYGTPSHNSDFKVRARLARVLCARQMRANFNYQVMTFEKANHGTGINTKDIFNHGIHGTHGKNAEGAFLTAKNTKNAKNTKIINAGKFFNHETHERNTKEVFSKKLSFPPSVCSVYSVVKISRSPFLIFLFFHLFTFLLIHYKEGQI